MCKRTKRDIFSKQERKQGKKEVICKCSNLKLQKKFVSNRHVFFFLNQQNKEQKNKYLLVIRSEKKKPAVNIRFVNYTIVIDSIGNIQYIKRIVPCESIPGMSS